MTWPTKWPLNSRNRNTHRGIRVPTQDLEPVPSINPFRFTTRCYSFPGINDINHSCPCDDIAFKMIATGEMIELCESLKSNPISFVVFLLLLWPKTPDRPIAMWVTPVFLTSRFIPQTSSVYLHVVTYVCSSPNMRLNAKWCIAVIIRLFHRRKCRVISLYEYVVLFASLDRESPLYFRRNWLHNGSLPLFLWSRCQPSCYCMYGDIDWWKCQAV